MGVSRSRTPEIALKQKWALARRHKRLGRYREALAGFLFVFDKSRQHPSSIGTRLSFLLSEIAELGAVYPKALEEIRHRRNALEDLIRNGNAGREEVIELEALNEHLNEQTRSIRFYDTHIKNGTKCKHLSKMYIEINWQLFAVNGRHKELSPVIRRLAYSISSALARYKLLLDYRIDEMASEENDPRDKDKDTNGRTIAYFVNKGILLYEVLLSDKRYKTSERLKAWLLRFKFDAATYADLVRAALKLGEFDLAKSLYGEASKWFHENELDTTKKAIEEFQKMNK